MKIENKNDGHKLYMMIGSFFKIKTSFFIIAASFYSRRADETWSGTYNSKKGPEHLFNM